ncbi:MAG: hypothetical protein AMJ88_18390 [Anaerolineae bacterium SM23_ 63]|nr:MAG: hypothetical protein AMJ88_18390 [Anaerolineae bacterium SM23_ 63]
MGVAGRGVFEGVGVRAEEGGSVAVAIQSRGIPLPMMTDSRQRNAGIPSPIPHVSFNKLRLRGDFAFIFSILH